MHSGKCGGCGTPTPTPYETCESCSYPSGGIITGCSGCNNEIVIKDVLTVNSKIIVTNTAGVVKQFDFCPSCQPAVIYNRPNNEPLVNGTELGVADYFTTEHLTGSKWIDGKDVYRKVIEINTPVETVLGNDIYFIDSTIGYDSLLDARGIIKVGNGMTLGSATFPIAGASHLYVPALQDIPNNINAGDLVLAFSAAKVTYIQIIIEYTK
jgi:hypothetical protein